MINKQNQFGVTGFANLWRDLSIILLGWCATLIIVNPTGNFPLNDDWAFASTVKHLLEYGEYRPTGWASMPLISNVLWGSIFCLPAGFSFDVLRLSTIIASLAGLGGFYLLLRELRQPSWLAIIAVLTLGFNPIYYSLSNTFMTDVFYTAVQLFAAYFFVRNLRRDSYADLLVATLLALTATLSRQLAVAVPLAFAVAVIFRRGINIRSVLSAIVPVALCVGALLGLQRWLAATGRLQPLYSSNDELLLQMLGAPKLLVTALLANSIVASIYLG
ncbi:MAG TPA: glycosyltransferase family 39 protein, partial [Spongiibacteraceae bacterium]|nr:glycosyltransferase family 39 protein [Spongiibacteraceae bacterium]